MRLLYLYALTDQPLRPEGRGLRGEPLCLLPAGKGLYAVAGEAGTLPRLTPEALKGHDATVRRLAEEASALLPFRFCAWVEDPKQLEERLAPRAQDLREALRQVKGCEQMTLRVFRSAPQPPEAEAPEEAMGPGTRYLTARARALFPPELAPLRRALSSLVRQERLAHHHTPPLLLSAYHLVPRRHRSAYLKALRVVEDCATLRVVPSGPWPPYAFAPEALP